MTGEKKGEIRTLKCPVCNKKFVPAPYHIYKTSAGGRLVCTYSCVLEYRRRRDEKTNIKNNKKGAKENEI